MVPVFWEVFHMHPATQNKYIYSMCYWCQCCRTFQICTKVKGSHNRPGVAQSIPGFLGSQIPWHSARKDGEIVRRTHRLPVPPGMFLVLIFTGGWVDPRAIVRSEGDMSLKNPVTPPGIDSGTVWLVVQCLNHYATPDPFPNMYSIKITEPWNKEYIFFDCLTLKM